MWFWTIVGCYKHYISGPSHSEIRRMCMWLMEMHKFKYWLCSMMARYLLLMRTFAYVQMNGKWRNENVYPAFTGFLYLFNLITLIAYICTHTHTLTLRTLNWLNGMPYRKCNAKCFSSFRLAIKFLLKSEIAECTERHEHQS